MDDILIMVAVTLLAASLGCMWGLHVGHAVRDSKLKVEYHKGRVDMIHEIQENIPVLVPYVEEMIKRGTDK